MTEQQFNKTNPRRKSGGDRGRGSSAGKKAGNESGGVVNKFTLFQLAEHPAGAGPAHLGGLLFQQAQFLRGLPQHRLGRFLPAAHEAARRDIPAAGISVFPELPPLDQQLSPGAEQA